MNKSLLRIVRLSAFIAIMLLMYLTPLGLIHIPPVNLTLYCIPVLAGTLLLGLSDGLVLGLSFGLLSLFGALTAPSASVALIMASGGLAPLGVVLMSILPRLIIPITAHFAKGLWASRGYASLAVAAAAGSLTNTVLYLGTMLILFLLCGLDNGALLGGIFGVTGLGALGEAILNAVVVPPIVLALQKTMGKTE